MRVRQILGHVGKDKRSQAGIFWTCEVTAIRSGAHPQALFGAFNLQDLNRSYCEGNDICAVVLEFIKYNPLIVRRVTVGFCFLCFCTAH